VALKKYFSRSIERRNGMVEEAADERQEERGRIGKRRDVM